MRRYCKILLIGICLAFYVQMKASVIPVPSWQELLDSSELVALVQYKNIGTFSASAKILKVYKGQANKGDKISISGFSTLHGGPFHLMKWGDKYLVFLEKSRNFSDVEPLYYLSSSLRGFLKVIGKKIKYDLIPSTENKKPNFHSLPEFESFLLAYYSDNNRTEFCSGIVNKLANFSEGDYRTQQFMMLYFLRYNQYDTVFEKYTEVQNIFCKYALAKLMGNIGSQESREVLITLLGDINSLVVVEAVRQLRHEPPEIVGPVLLKSLKSTKKLKVEPFNIVDPMMFRENGAKEEIIYSLGEMNYQPAIPDLIQLLATQDVILFETLVDALKSMGRKDHIEYINMHLENQTPKFISSVSGIIVRDSLVECLPSYKNFISNCNKNSHFDPKYLLSDFFNNQNFVDSSTISYLLNEYNRLLNYMDTLEWANQKKWMEAFILSFTELKVKEARSMVYKSIAKWYAVNEDFGRHPELYKVKKSLEDSFIHIFESRMGKNGYEINHCLAFIENTAEVVNGSQPKVKFIVQITVPKRRLTLMQKQRIINEFGLQEQNVYVVTKGDHSEDFNHSIEQFYAFGLFYEYLEYCISLPNPDDLIFLQELLKVKFIEDNRNQKMIITTIEKIKTLLQEH